MWNVGYIGCWECVMLGMWDVGDMECWVCGMLRMWDVGDVGCSGCRMFRMWNVPDVGYLLGCGMLIYKMPSLLQFTNLLLNAGNDG